MLDTTNSEQPKASRQTFKMSDDLWHRVKIQAAVEKRTIRELVNQAIEKYLQTVQGEQIPPK